MTGPSDYLHRCLELFPETMQQRHGWLPDYPGLEKRLAPIRAGERNFTYHDLEVIQDRRYWDFREFWRFPDESQFHHEIDGPDMTSMLRALPLDESASLVRLQEVFKSIENVSVLLRFVHPEQYGILSPPVEKVLEVRRGRTGVETYLNYLRDIRSVRDHHLFERAADVDMALWVLEERVLTSYRDHDLLVGYREDAFLHRVRTVNLLAELGEADDPLAFARALVEVHRGLAAALASFAFEKILRRSGGDDRIKVADLLPFDTPSRGLHLRHLLTDPDRPASRDEVMELIELAEELETRTLRKPANARKTSAPKPGRRPTRGA